MPKTTRRGLVPLRPSSIAMRAVAALEPAPFLGRAALSRALEKHLGGPGEVEAFLAEALDDAGLEAVPEGREPFEAFVRETILSKLVPIVRLPDLHDFVRRTIGGEEDVHPPPIRRLGSPVQLAQKPAGRPRVVVVEPSSIRRIELARALVRDGFDVEVVATPGEVLEVEPFHALVMGLGADAERVVEALVARGTRAGLVTYDEPDTRAALPRVIDRWPSDRVAIVTRSATPQLLCARVRIVLT